MRNKYPTPIYSSPLEALRNERGWTQDQAAQHIRSDTITCDLKTFRSWEKGYTYPDAEHLKRLSVVFDVSTDYLMGLSKERHIGNKEISAITGLSENSIEALRFLSTRTGDEDTDKEHRKSVDLINLVFENAILRKSQYQSAPDEHGPLSTVFSTMMEYIDTKQVTLAFWDNGKRKELSGTAATLEMDGEPVVYTVAELSRTVLIERIKRYLENMRTHKEA